MNILMMTNTFTPHVGGVARSVEAFTAEYRERGHRVLVVAPAAENAREDEVGVARVPAIQHFNGSDFSVALPTSGFLTSTIEAFRPDIVHAHHPFLVGGTALRVAHLRRLPLVFTHHTMYEQYTHYVPGDSEALKRFVINLSTSYANLCDQVLAPSESIAATLRERRVAAPISVVPTGVRVARFAGGRGRAFRTAMHIPREAFVVGHVGRLAPEKNLRFLADAVAAFLDADASAHFLMVGSGPSEGLIRDVFARRKLAERLHMPGVQRHPLLAGAYAAMDVFAFASKSETQGMVLTEAAAAGVPVVALDAPGAREVVADRVNGRLLAGDAVEEFAAALAWLASLDAAERSRLRQKARDTADLFSIERAVDKALGLYEGLREKEFVNRQEAYTLWTGARRLIKAEWGLLKGVVEAAGSSRNADAQ